jgi:hypothetical protein
MPKPVETSAEEGMLTTVTLGTPGRLKADNFCKQKGLQQFERQLEPHLGRQQQTTGTPTIAGTSEALETPLLDRMYKTKSRYLLHRNLYFIKKE